MYRLPQRSRTMGLLAVAASLVGATSTLAAGAGDLDPSFAGNGRQTTNLGGDVDTANAVAVYPDGRVIVVGEVSPTVSSDDRDFALARYTPDGELDPTFGDDGMVTSSITPGWDEAHGVALQPSGRIVVAGVADRAGDADIAVVRYEEDGDPDATFAGDGVELVDLGGHEFGMDVVIDDADRILVGASSDAGAAIIAYTPTGARHESFGRDGIKTSRYLHLTALALPSSRTIVVAGDRDGLARCRTGFALMRLTSRGRSDRSFAQNGRRTICVGEWGAAHDVTVDFDGRVVAVGRGGPLLNGAFAVVRFLDNGRLDRGFSRNGRAEIDFGPYADSALAVATPGNGKVLVAGTDETFDEGRTSDWAVARLTERGKLDPSFAHAGKRTIGFGPGADTARDAALAPGRRLVLAGNDASGFEESYRSDFAVARLNLASSPDAGPPAVVQVTYQESDDGSSPARALYAFVRRADRVDLATRYGGRRARSETRHSRSITDTDIRGEEAQHPWVAIPRKGGRRVKRLIHKALGERGRAKVRVIALGSGARTVEDVLIVREECAQDPPFYPLTCEVRVR